MQRNEMIPLHISHRDFSPIQKDSNFLCNIARLRDVFEEHLWGSVDVARSFFILFCFGFYFWFLFILFCFILLCLFFCPSNVNSGNEWLIRVILFYLRFISRSKHVQGGGRSVSNTFPTSKIVNLLLSVSPQFLHGTLGVKFFFFFFPL